MADCDREGEVDDAAVVDSDGPTSVDDDDEVGRVWLPDPAIVSSSSSFSCLLLDSSLVPSASKV